MATGSSFFVCVCVHDKLRINLKRNSPSATTIAVVVRPILPPPLFYVSHRIWTNSQLSSIDDLLNILVLHLPLHLRPRLTTVAYVMESPRHSFRESAQTCRVACPPASPAHGTGELKENKSCLIFFQIVTLVCFLPCLLIPNLPLVIIWFGSKDSSPSFSAIHAYRVLTRLISKNISLKRLRK